jgi:hypothetical protein
MSKRPAWPSLLHGRSSQVRSQGTQGRRLSTPEGHRVAPGCLIPLGVSSPVHRVVLACPRTRAGSQGSHAPNFRYLILRSGRQGVAPPLLQGAVPGNRSERAAMASRNSPSSIRRLHIQQLLAFAIAPVFLLLALHSAVGHFEGKDRAHWALWIPIYFGIEATLVLVILGGMASRRRGWFNFRLAFRLVGVLALLVGLVGTGFHLSPVLNTLRGETPFTWAALLGALSVGPSLFAPSAFAGLGGLLWVLASKRVLLRFLYGQFRHPVESAVKVPQDT